MAEKTFSRRNLDFILFETLQVEKLQQFDYFKAHDRETYGFTLDIASDLAKQIMQPAYQESDRQQPELIDGQVKVHASVHSFIKAFSEAGLMAAPFSETWGGMQLPKTIAAAAEFIMGSAHNSLVMYTDLSKGAANLIYTFGNEAQKALFLPKMLSGEWMGTMCLTEPQAGSSLSDVATAASPQPDGTYLIKGQKIFISAGDQDVTDNIVHLVLARVDGAPKGTKGISLFVVPKKRLNDAGALEDNDVVSIGIYHKMGQKATPAMHLEFGAQGDCVGYLLGEMNRGLPHMFLMMNGARLGVGMGGIHIASAAYYASLQYAQERPQGRRLNKKEALVEPVSIIQHPDVRRMLFLQKAIVEGGLCLVLQCYQYLDLEKVHAEEPELKKHYNQLLELLTPVAKTYGAEMGFVAVNQGLQVLGGYGYTEDFPLEQLARDVRIMSLYEGTTGIQSQALLGRQVVGNQGKTLVIWYNEVGKTIHPAEHDPTLGPYWEALMASLRQFQKVTAHQFKLATEGDMEVLLADANLYMEAFGILNVAWQWLLQGIAAVEALKKVGIQGEELTFYQSKIETLRFYFHYELPRLQGLYSRLQEDIHLTIFDEESEFLI
ncbi:acyl-CoA dehydrogenase [Haliscomenobacter sp.]|uniref:acyl-CoA dehydrogenase n=1 Tax=Haliscomenobacter sp. TaxID=2717303 RepID=UPI003BAB8616